MYSDPERACGEERYDCKYAAGLTDQQGLLIELLGVVSMREEICRPRIGQLRNHAVALNTGLRRKAC
jgi:hypothetical protein